MDLKLRVVITSIEQPKFNHKINTRLNQIVNQYEPWNRCTHRHCKLWTEPVKTPFLLKLVTRLTWAGSGWGSNRLQLLPLSVTMQASPVYKALYRSYRAGVWGLSLILGSHGVKRLVLWKMGATSGIQQHRNCFDPLRLQHRCTVIDEISASPCMNIYFTIEGQ